MLIAYNLLVSIKFKCVSIAKKKVGYTINKSFKTYRENDIKNEGASMIK